MELTLLGTGTCAPNRARTPACYFLSIGPTRIIIDPGPGAINRIVAEGIDPYDIEAIFITHHHPDHCADLIPFLFSYKHCLGFQQKKDVKIVAPEGFKEKVFDGLMDVWGEFTLSEDYTITVDEVMDETWEKAGIRYTTAPMLHGANAVGYRFEKIDDANSARDAGPTLTYSGDTGYCEELIELAKGADTLLIECSLPDKYAVDGHMRPSDVAKAAVESGAKRIVLTHFYPVVDTVKAVASIREGGYEGEIIVGEDGMKVTI